MMKWRDQRDVLMLSTCHGTGMKEVTQRRGTSVMKPEIVVDYNQSKAFTDLSDQMTAYSPYFRRTVKWYRRLALEIVSGICMVNSLIIYNIVNNGKMSVTDFKQKVVEQLLFPSVEIDQDRHIDLPRSRSASRASADRPEDDEAEDDPKAMDIAQPDPQPEPQPGPSRPRTSTDSLMLTHKLEKIEGKNNRRKCKRCYKLMVREKGSKYSQLHSKKVSTKCNICNQFLCLLCFNEIHKNCT